MVKKEEYAYERFLREHGKRLPLKCGWCKEEVIGGLIEHHGTNYAKCSWCDLAERFIEKCFRGNIEAKLSFLDHYRDRLHKTDRRKLVKAPPVISQ